RAGVSVAVQDSTPDRRRNALACAVSDDGCLRLGALVGVRVFGGVGGRRAHVFAGVGVRRADVFGGVGGRRAHVFGGVGGRRAHVFGAGGVGTARCVAHRLD